MVLLNNHGGKIILILGCMMSGKSSELLRLLRRYRLGGKRCLLIKYGEDLRYSSDQNEMSTHDRQTAPATPALTLAEIETVYHQNLDEYDVILCDEAQFYPDAAVYAEKWANSGKIVVMSALNGTYERKPFPVVSELVPLAEEIRNFNAVCLNCSSDTAAFSSRRTNETGEKLIGGADKYEAVCRLCYHQKWKERHDS